MTLTTATLDLFLALANDAANWNGQPIIDITKEQRGNLTQLKRARLLETFRDEGCDFAIFTSEGKAFALSNGISI